MRLIGFFIIICFTHFCYGQKTDLFAKNTLERIVDIKYNRQNIDLKSNHKYLINMRFEDLSSLIGRMDSLGLSSQILHRSEEQKFLIAKLNLLEFEQVKCHLTDFDVRFSSPSVDSYLSDFDPSANGILKAKNVYPEYFDFSSNIGLKENNPQVNDIDLLGRIRISSISSERMDNHASDMATILAGNGNNYYTSEGILPQSTITTSTFLNLMPDDAEFMTDNQVFIQNHSYGLEVEDYYGIEAQLYDQQVYNHPEFLHVFSSGNRGMEDAIFSPYAEVEGFSNLSGTFKHSKNVLTVGAVDSSLNLLPISSTGPAYDGRVKPELVAYGYGGTSEAAAIVSGCAALLREVLIDKGLSPEADMLKAILITGAEDIGPKGPDFKSGYGNVNLYNSLKVVEHGKLQHAEIYGVDSFKDSIIISADSDPAALFFTLVWTDSSAEIDAPVALINDLDIKVVHESGTIYHPFVLDSRPSSESLNKNATTGIDTLNTIEQITIVKPESGKYVVEVSSKSSSPMKFALVQYINSKRLEILHPTQDLFINNADDLYVRWNNTTGEPLNLDYKIGDSIFTVLQIPADVHNHRISIPQTTDIMELKIYNEAFQDSISFPVSEIPKMELAWRCQDSSFFNINNIALPPDLILYELLGDEMVAVDQTQEPNWLYTKNSIDQEYLAVSNKIFGSHYTHRSLALNPENFFGECYFNLAYFRERESGLEVFLELKALKGIEEIALQKKINGIFVDINAFELRSLHYAHLDENLISGNNAYRFKIKLENGVVKYSNTVNYLFVPPDDIIIFPTILLQDEGFDIRMGTFAETQILLFNAAGQLVRNEKIFSAYEFFDTEDLSQGMYFYIFTREEKWIKTGKLVILP